MKMHKKRLPFSSQMVNLGEINKTFMKSRVLLILIFSSFLLVNCGGTKGEGSVGDVTVVQGELPEETESIDLFWRITGQPDASKLSMRDLEFNEDKSEMSFTPDAPGKFQFELEVFQYGDELETQKFTYTVDSIEPLVADASEESLSDESEDWLDEEYEEELNDDSEDTYMEDDEYDYDEFDSEDSLEYYETDNNEASIDENKEEELIPLEIATKKETSSTPIPVKTQTTATKPPVKKKSTRYVIPYDKSRFTIQVASKKNLNDAEKVAANLIESGYDAYIQKAYFRDTDEVWFRVRVGSYDNRDTALAVGKVIANAMTMEVWVDFVRFEE
ncbi:SPOR domain-containing protein [Candidatus Marinimicrobia bacterium]|nr:SPOR domain-containing protein [Candidatus Neomarinimicrobiota bacterium]